MYEMFLGVVLAVAAICTTYAVFAFTYVWLHMMRGWSFSSWWWHHPAKSAAIGSFAWAYFALLLILSGVV